MASINFVLKNPKAEKETPIMMVIRYEHSIVRFYSGYKRHPSEFPTNKSKILNNGTPLASNLKEMSTEAEKIIRIFQDKNNRLPGSTELKRELDIKYERMVNDIPSTFIEYVESFIKKMETKRKATNKYNSRNDLTKSFLQTLNWIKMFSKKRNRRINFDSINDDFYADFVGYLRKPEKPENLNEEETSLGLRFNPMSENTIGKHIKNLKRFLFAAIDDEVNKYNKFKKFEVHNEEAETIFLNEAEIQKIFDLDLSDNKKLERVRDLFIVGCWTGLRFSDFTNIKKKNFYEHNGGQFLKIKTQKTGKEVVIPVLPHVLKIMNRYKENENSLPAAMSNPELNKLIKTIGKVAGIDTPIDIEKENGMKYGVKKPKYELITAHTSRRSFATNMYRRKIPTLTIMAITGHKSERAFLRYIRVTPEQHAEIIQSHFQDENLSIAR